VQCGKYEKQGQGQPIDISEPTKRQRYHHVDAVGQPRDRAAFPPVGRPSGDRGQQRKWHELHKAK